MSVETSCERKKSHPDIIIITATGLVGYVDEQILDRLVQGCVDCSLNKNNDQGGLLSPISDTIIANCDTFTELQITENVGSIRATVMVNDPQYVDAVASAAKCGIVDHGVVTGS